MDIERDEIGEDLIRAVRNRDGDAFHRLCEQMTGTMRALVFQKLDRKTLVKEGASDVVQDCLLKAWANVGDFNGTTVSEFHAWLLRIVENLANDRYKYWRRRLRDVSREQPIAPASAGPVPIPSRAPPSTGKFRRVDAVWAALYALPDLQREAVRLQKFEGWSQSQIADRLGCSATAVQGLLRRGKARLASILRHERDQGNL